MNNFVSFLTGFFPRKSPINHGVGKNKFYLNKPFKQQKSNERAQDDISYQNCEL